MGGLCMIKTRMKPARKAGTRVAFGKEIKVKAAPAKKIVKAFCVSALEERLNCATVLSFNSLSRSQAWCQLRVWGCLHPSRAQGPLYHWYRFQKFAFAS